VILLGVVYYFANQYINTIELEASTKQSQNTSIQLNIVELKNEYISYEGSYESFNSQLNELPEYLEWGTIVSQLEEIESSLGMDIQKTFDDEVELADDSKFANLPAEIKVINVNLFFISDMYTLNEYIRGINDIENLVLIDYVSSYFLDDTARTEIYLKFFTYDNRDL